MRSKFGFFLILLVLLVSMLGATPEAGEAHHFNWGRFIGSVLNSTLLFGALILFLRKPLIKLLTQRSLDIKSDMAERERNLKTASQEFEKISLRLDEIEREVQEMKQSAQQKGEEQKVKIEKLGEQESQRILNLTRNDIENRVESSLIRLKSKIARLTIDRFEKDIESRLDEDAHRKIIEKNIDIVGEVIDKENLKSNL
jgi:F-type H+-transporting ATPase subunit b